MDEFFRGMWDFLGHYWWLVFPLVVVATLGAGLVWGAMARSFGRLVPSILSHALFDWTVIVLFRFWGPPV